ncbi:MAG: SDR family NAD(P)-dependent oxidoreductase [Hyphomicrobiales bacterium]|nr:SDR family NAD(P)-dependent oxidoreductase [Hyphomicrobiales bacterium]MCP4997921.1 SDR family NAD(P)-dependent oxidoreductase [Hyphomicrobiales bacterium]
MSVLDKFDLTDKTALVTGCKRGIGLAMATALAEAGADIIGVSASLEIPGSVAEQTVTALGRKFSAYRCDFSDRQSVREFAETVNREHPQIDILVNNAGTIKRAPAVDHGDELWDEVIEVNLTADLIGLLIAAPAIVPQILQRRMQAKSA